MEKCVDCAYFMSCKKADKVCNNYKHIMQNVNYVQIKKENLFKKLLGGIK